MSSVVNLESLSYSAGLRVKSGVQVVLSELNMRLFDLIQTWMLCRYGCFMCLCCLSAEVCCSNCDAVCIGRVCVFEEQVYNYEVYMLSLKSVGERTPLLER